MSSNDHPLYRNKHSQKLKITRFSDECHIFRIPAEVCQQENEYSVNRA